MFSFDTLELSTGCMFPCRDDTECFDNELCACTLFARPHSDALVELGACHPAACKVDADCGPDRLCAAPVEPVPFAPELPSTFNFFACSSPRDECRGNEDCPPTDDKSCCAENLCSHEGLAQLACHRREHCAACY
jgi:hypothetical protein